MAGSQDLALTRPLLVVNFLLLTVSLRALSLNSDCDFSFVDRKKLYTFNLASPVRNFPHGILNEDGYYKVESNETVLWFQLCDGMVFNHDPPKCVDCVGCGGSSRCGMECSALVSMKEGGYPVCTTIGHASGIAIDVIDKKHPHTGVIVRMSSIGKQNNCSLIVSVICDKTGVEAPHSLEKSGRCDYVTELKHPSGCAEIGSVHGKGWGWFSTFLLILLCLFGAYLLAGTIYRHFYLGIHGIDVIPNMEFWISIPQRTQMQMKYAEGSKEAVTFIEQGHIRVGLDTIIDPAYLVTRNMQDFITWVDTSNIKRKVLQYNDKLDDYDAMN